MTNEKFLQTIAKQYVKETGQKFLAENAALNATPTLSLDTKVKAARRRAFFARSRVLVSVAASIAVAMIVWFAILPQNQPRHTFEYATPDTMPAGVSPAANAPAAAPDEAVNWAIPGAPPATQMPQAEREQFYFFRNIMDGSFVTDESDDIALRTAGAADNEPSPEMGGFGAVAMPVSPQERGAQYGATAEVEPQEMELYGITPPPGWVIVWQDGSTVVFQLESDESVLVRINATDFLHLAEFFNSFNR